MNPDKFLPLIVKAANLAADTCRRAFIGCVAVRKDGAIVASRNSSIWPPIPYPLAHAEARALRKAGAGAIVFVGRIRKDGSIGLAKPCSRCYQALKHHDVRRVYYTVSDNQWAVL
jgi:tRNA(Arg) A34 adenosine deaminase TadA